MLVCGLQGMPVHASPAAIRPGELILKNRLRNHLTLCPDTPGPGAGEVYI